MWKEWKKNKCHPNFWKEVCLGTYRRDKVVPAPGAIGWDQCAARFQTPLPSVYDQTLPFRYPIFDLKSGFIHKKRTQFKT